MYIAINNGRMAIYGEIFPPIDLPAFLKELEASIIERTVLACGGNQAKAGKILKLKRTTLNAKKVGYKKKSWIANQWAKEISFKPEENSDEDVPFDRNLAGND